MTNVTLVFYLRRKGAEDQVMELLKCLNLSCRAARGSKGENIIYILLPAAQHYGSIMIGEKKSGLTGVHLELIHHPENFEPFVPQNVWL